MYIKWSFHYPLYNAAEDPRHLLQEDNVHTKTYAFALPPGQAHQEIHVQEVLTESKFAFSIPLEYLKVVLPWRKQDLLKLEIMCVLVGV